MDESDKGLYQYRFLDHKDQVRVLVLEPALDFSDPLVGKIEHVDRKDLKTAEKRYEAVSYCWGEPDFCDTLRIEDESTNLRITPNVNILLRYLRSQSSYAQPRRLWIDSVSLNQDDEWEKSEQVQRMDKIYGDAKEVHVWLGEEENGDSGLFGLFPGLSSTLLEDSQITWGPNVVSVIIGDFFQRPWFNRRWVLQEVAFGSDVTVWCGALTMKWPMFAQGISALQKGMLEFDKGRFAIPSPLLTEVLLICSLRPGTTRLFDLLRRFSAFECSDARDRIFALLGLASDADSYDLSYALTPKDLYRELALFCIEHSDRQDLASEMSILKQEIAKIGLNLDLGKLQYVHKGDQRGFKDSSPLRRVERSQK